MNAPYAPRPVAEAETGAATAPLQSTLASTLASPAGLLALQQALWAAEKSTWLWDVQPDQLVLSSPLPGCPAAALADDLPDTLAALLARVHPGDRSALELAVQAHLRGDAPRIHIDFRLQQAQAWRWLRIRGRALRRGADGLALQIAGTVRDVSEQQPAEQALARLALFDSLTGLANRAAINQHLAARVARPGAPGFSLMFIDLDGFKSVNDSFGHRAGDVLLQQTAERLRNALPQAFIGRWGGDEFVVVLADAEGDALLRDSARLVLAALGQPFLIDGHRLTVTPSIGAVSHPADGEDVALLLRRADAAMYAAKAQGRNGLVVYAPALDAGSARRSRLQGLLRSDAERNAFHFVVQPQVNAAGRHTGAELLMRWTTREFGAVAPAEFIPLAEQTGLIPLMGRHALHAAARIAHELRALGSDARVAVNLSPRQLLRPDLERSLLQACEQNRSEPAQIMLELTEVALLSDFAAVEKLLPRLRRQGFHLALDNFGTGCSSLNHLRRLPFHQIKIHRSCVMDLERSPPARVMLEGLVRLCSNLGLATLAEGVETEAQFALLRAMGVDSYQGYLFARPQWQAEWMATLRQELAG